VTGPVTIHLAHLAAWVEGILPLTDCDACWGRGGAQCKVCEGEGTHDCGDARCGDQHDCGACGGDGYDPCDKQCHAEWKPVVMDLEGVRVDAWDVRAILHRYRHLDLGTVERIQPDWLRFEIGTRHGNPMWRALVMGCDYFEEEPLAGRYPAEQLVLGVL